MTSTLVSLVLVAVHPHLKMLGQDEVFLGVLLIPVFLGNLEHVAPFGGTVLRSPAGILPAGNHHKGGDSIRKSKKQQAPGGVFCPVNGKRGVHSCWKLPQQVYEVHPVVPAPGSQQRRPPDDGKG